MNDVIKIKVTTAAMDSPTSTYPTKPDQRIKDSNLFTVLTIISDAPTRRVLIHFQHSFRRGQITHFHKRRGSQIVQFQHVEVATLKAYGG
ncbi:MAG: hypothetical protein ACPGCO_08600 [Flavobacteriaceae bacterium]